MSAGDKRMSVRLLRPMCSRCDLIAGLSPGIACALRVPMLSLDPSSHHPPTLTGLCSHESCSWQALYRAVLLLDAS